MVRADEETRAREFWRKEDRLRRARIALNRSMGGNAASAQQLRRDWEPVILARLEARLVERNDEDE